VYAELQIRPKMEIFRVVKKWRRWVEKYTHQRPDSLASSKYKFVYKREAMVTVEAERRITDSSALKLLYGEARNNFMSGRYPISSVSDGVQLASLQLQVSFGDFQMHKHGPGTGFIAYVYCSVNNFYELMNMS
jgi:hypothetical protein